MKAAEKIIEALTQLMEGFSELQDEIENEYGISTEDEELDEAKGAKARTAAESALVAEMRAALESVIESEDYSPEEVATLLGSITEALEEIDPNIFEDEVLIPVSDDVADDDDDDYDDLDDDLYDDEDLDEDEEK